MLKKLGILVAIVSGGTKMALERSLPLAILSQFDVVISADDVENGKPSPEPYFKAAEALGLPPQDCLVIENAPMGIRAAKSAGMRCIGLCTTLDAKYLVGADKILPSHDELACELKRFFSIP